MSPIEQIVSNMGAFLATHTLLSYTILFLGSYFDTLIGTGFFVYGELFFLPGAIIAGTGVLDIWLVTLSLVIGGILGDSSSFFLGKRYGTRFFKEENRIFNMMNYQKGEQFFNKYGVKAVFFARLMGPLSWITPFLAGTYNIKFTKFLTYNIPGVIVGIGEFILIGYFFGNSYKTILPFVQKELATVLFGGLFLAIVYFMARRNDPNFFARTKSSLKSNYKK